MNHTEGNVGCDRMGGRKREVGKIENKYLWKIPQMRKSFGYLLMLHVTES